MTVIGLDDTDSRTRGMCTTYLAARLAERLRETAAVERLLLVRCNPAVEHKTRGNAALGIHTDADAGRALALARETLPLAETTDPNTNPGVVVAAGDPGGVPDAVAEFARTAVRGHHDIDAATALIEACGYASLSEGNGRGRIGALAAVGAWQAFADWTHEHIVYRERDRWGSDREVDRDSVFDAAEEAYPVVWDTVDTVEGEAVCVPHTPGPVLYGIRGDAPEACRTVATAIESEPIAAAETFVTNQGTDAHLRPGSVATAREGYSYRLDGRVAAAPETREGGHVFFPLDDGGETIRCAAFEPTKRFRDRVRALRSGDALTVCGEVSDGTLKLEKFAVRALVRTEPANPTCPDCGRSMESAGAEQGYRCRDCGTTAPGKVDRSVDRALDRGWY